MHRKHEHTMHVKIIYSCCLLCKQKTVSFDFLELPPCYCISYSTYIVALMNITSLFCDSLFIMTRLHIILRHAVEGSKKSTVINHFHHDHHTTNLGAWPPPKINSQCQEKAQMNQFICCEEITSAYQSLESD